MTTHEHREQWLADVTARIAPWYAEMGVAGLPRVRVGVGFTSKGLRSKRVGECWAPECSGDGACEIFIHPKERDATAVAAILAHELIHAAVGHEAKHGPAFKRAALALGLEGKMTATTPGPMFLARIGPVLEAVGPYPHAGLTPQDQLTSTGPKQTTRMLKVECDGCGYTLRAARKWLDVAVPSCPVCVVPMREAV